MPSARLLCCLFFAAAAGLGALAWLDAMGPRWGTARALSLYLLMLPVAYPLVAAPSLKKGLLAVAMGGALTAPFAIWLPDPRAAALVSALVVSVSRAIVLVPTRGLAGLGREAVLAAGALGAGALAFDSSELGTSLAVWSFWLIQAAGVLFAPAAQQSVQPAPDPFEQAHAAAVKILLAPERGVTDKAAE